jgi:Domain of unknown function (DUF4190)
MSVTPDEPDEPRRGEPEPPDSGEPPQPPAAETPPPPPPSGQPPPPPPSGQPPPPPPFGQPPPPPAAPPPYGPPSSGQVPPYGQPPPYEQVPPYGQPPSYGQYGYDSGAGYGVVPRPSTKATVALILSIVGLLLCPLLFSLIGLVLASQAKREIAASGGSLTGAGMAQAAFIISIVGLVFWLLGLLLSAAGVISVNVPRT